jgi:dihydroorotate dehydrogenase
MRLRGIEYGPVWGASGVQGFFGEGYQYHKLLKIALPGMFSFRGLTFVAKTTTLKKNVGNMPMKADGITPVEFKPKCIVVDHRRGVALNSVGLSGPGAEALLSTGRWQSRTKPFVISFMSIKPTAEERIAEALEFFALLKKFLPEFKSPVALQINFSCPNVGLDPGHVIGEVTVVLTEAAELGIPIVPKFNHLLPVSAAYDIAKHPQCDAFCIPNTYPWKDFPPEEKITYFGSEESPLAHLGGGGVSGRPLFERTLKWLDELRYDGVRIPINAGGGVMETGDAKTLRRYGADSIMVGSVAFLRPWRLQSIIQEGRKIFV